ncbi:MAG: bifunctional anthranilate synthase component I family protein/class IV aminotransferase, partial [Verrucomicrobia bacterium]|nr:bifunctional anthranilate synthase component I family protein/class IV aminotransferase [Verrucomicrobiota bacterium]
NAEHRTNTDGATGDGSADRRIGRGEGGVRVRSDECGVRSEFGAKGETLPLARFSLYREQHPGLPEISPQDFTCYHWQYALDEAAFSERVRRIRDAIAAGETYQVNFTTPGYAEFRGDPLALFRAMLLGQAARHQAYFDEGDRVILSASPELFFRLENGRIDCRPMKGTAAPGQEAALRASLKDRAENVMIVDMIRNDLGKVADTGSVRVSSLFDVETYPSLVQMTSTVQAAGSATVWDWLRALFPCASITGAPKRNTMAWIRELETGPRGIYTGCIGGLYGDGVTEFNVAIRTAVIDRTQNILRYDTGCGIVWDSEPAEEFRESRLKSHIVRHPAQPYELIETMRWTPEDGCAQWPWHRKRLLQSADTLGFAVDPERLEREFDQQTQDLTAPTRLRLLADVDGHLSWTLTPWTGNALEPMTFCIDSVPTPSTHPHLRNKTTRRDLYAQARARFPEVDEVLLLNERGELMEFTIGNLIVEIDGVRYTPPQSSGLLPGTTRAMLLEKGNLQEKILHPADLERAQNIHMINAVRGEVGMKHEVSKTNPNFHK